MWFIVPSTDNSDPYQPGICKKKKMWLYKCVCVFFTLPWHVWAEWWSCWTGQRGGCTCRFRHSWLQAKKKTKQKKNCRHCAENPQQLRPSYALFSLSNVSLRSCTRDNHLHGRYLQEQAITHFTVTGDWDLSGVSRGLTSDGSAGP